MPGNRPSREPAIIEASKQVLTWIAIVAVVIMAILLPVLVVTGLCGGQPLAGTVALIGMVLLAFGVTWYVRTHHGRRSG